MKRWISILLIASLLFTFLPTGGAAQAEPTATTHSHDGWTALYSNSSVFKGQDPLNAGKYYLTGNVDATGFITINGDVTLCLNGKVLDLHGAAIKVGSGDHLTICDCSSVTHNGNIGDGGLWQASASPGSCNLTGGVITSTSSVAGNSSAVSVEGGGSLTLASGNIAGNTAGSNGGGGVSVYGSDSSFTMAGGSIIGNRADKKNGGGVSVASGSFTMNGGSIANNTASGDGGGYGGGVYVTDSDSSFTMNGGSISGNSAMQWGGGVYVNNSSFTMTDGSISGNTASSGGGVHVNGSSFTMSSGNITGNHASGVGGGVTLNNSSSTSMTLSGDVDITSNTTANTTAANAPSNVYLPQGRVITIGGPLTGSQNIGVSMAQPGIFTSGLLGKGSLDNFTSDDSDYSLLLDGGEAALHAHSYSYFAKGALITQKCICGHHATATLLAPTDCTYDGQAKTASMQYDGNWQGSRNWTISYTKDGQSVSKVKEAGTYTASVTIDEATASVTFTIEKASQTAPNEGEGYAIDYGNETITVTSGYEVCVDGEWQTGTITLAPGTSYEVRKAAANGVPASAAVSFTTAARPEAPAGITVDNESIKGKGDGALTGITSDMEYKLGNGSWTNGTGDALTNLAAGTTVTVRLKATNTAPHGVAQTYTVEAGAPLTVIFNSNGGSDVASIEDLSYNASITAPIAPTKNGYTFVGWYKDEALNQEWDFNSEKVTADTTLYAKWTANTNTAYTVKHWQQKLDAENYTCVDTENGTGTTGASVTPAVNTYEGFTAPNAQTVTIAADGSTVVNYYYTRNNYTVSLSPGTGIASVSGAGTYAYGAAVTIDADVEDGYSWQQWSDGNAEQSRSFTMGASDVSLTAQATLNQYTITYDLAGGALPDDAANPDSYTVESAAITLANPTKTGHAFAGWTGTGLDGAYPTVTIAQGSTGNRAYTATWTANSYAITYAGMDGAEAGEHQPTSHTYGTATTVSDPTKTGYTFAGWRVNGSGEAVKDLTLGAEAYTADITLTAAWTANHYTVAFDANGGSGTMAPQAFTYDEAQALAAASFTRAGCTFAGWNTAADGSGTSFADGTSVVNLSAEDGVSVTLYAQWTEDAKYSLSGEVTESDGTGAAGATVTLMQGVKEIAQTTTDSSGCYVFTNIPAGIYNIVTEKDDVTTTTMVTVDADHETMPGIKLPEGCKNATVDNSEAGAFAAAVGGLNEIANNAQVANGETVTITLAVTEKEDVTNSTEAEDEKLKQEQAAIKQEASAQTLAFLDLSLLKTTTQNGVEGTPENIGGNNDKLLTIVVPFATDNRCHITVYRYHGTAAEALPEGSENAVNGEYFSVGDGIITICAKNFSTYAIGYSNPPSTGGSVGLAPIVTESEHGSVQLSPSRPSIGQIVTITPQPNEGYIVAAVTVTDASGQALTVTKNHDGTWSYEQPRGQVTIAVTFRLASDASDCPQDNSCPLAGYSDLQMHTWYHDCVHYCLENGLMVGMAQGVFSPDAALTRAQAVVILWRNEGSPLVEQPLDFDDVADDDWYADAVRWAVATDVMSGYGNGRFGADDPMTREQMASMFHRFAFQKGIAVSEGAAVDLESFSDADVISSWALGVVQWACDTGLLRGFEDGRLDPTGNTTRAQYSAMIMRFLEDITQ